MQNNGNNKAELSELITDTESEEIFEELQEASRTYATEYPSNEEIFMPEYISPVNNSKTDSNNNYLRHNSPETSNEFQTLVTTSGEGQEILYTGDYSNKVLIDGEHTFATAELSDLITDTESEDTLKQLQEASRTYATEYPSNEEIFMPEYISPVTNSKTDSNNNYLRHTSLETSNEFQNVVTTIGEGLEILYTGDYSNKVLIDGGHTVAIVKGNVSLENVGNVLFVLNKSAEQQIKNNEYHLDNLQYDIAKAIGIEPEKLKLLYEPKPFRIFKKNYTNVELTEMLEPISKSVRVNPLKYVEVDMAVDIELPEYEDSIVVVYVLKLTSGTQWLGGYRNVKTGIYYHNATTQTCPRQQTNYSVYYSPNELCSRDTQTHITYKDVGINLSEDHSTQTLRFDHYICNISDVFISPKPYKPFDEIFGEKAREKAAIVIQKHWKRYKLRKYVNELRKYVIKLGEIKREYFGSICTSKDSTELQSNPFFNSLQQNVLDHFNEEEFNSHLLNMMFPYRRKDFYRLYYLLNKYKANNIAELKSIQSSSYRQAEICTSLEKENEILFGIEKQNIFSSKDAILKENILEHFTAPIIKPNYAKDIFCLMEKKETERCKEFKELYVLCFLREDLSVEQRIEILLLFMNLIEAIDVFEMKEDLLEMIKRETIMLSCGVPYKYLKALTKRMQEIIDYFITSSSTCTVPASFVGKEVYRCHSCNKIKDIKDFPIHCRHKKMKKCKLCFYIYRAPRSTINATYFRNILQEIRTDEYRHGCRNPYAFLIQPSDIQIIIKQIWGSKSVFSNTAPISELRLPRWQNQEAWAPWNCVLLTADEAKVHKTVYNLSEFYGKELCNIVRIKQFQGLLQFQQLAETESQTRNLWGSMANNVINAGTKTLLKAFMLTGDSFFYSPKKKFIC